MLGSRDEWARAIRKTRVLRHPRQHLATFGATSVAYFVVTEPIYQDLAPTGGPESVVRRGVVKAERPAIVTPTYALHLEGFSQEAYRYLEHLAQQYGPHSPGVLYQYKNEPAAMDTVSGPPEQVGERICQDLDRRQENMAAVLLGVDELWDLSLLKFIFEFTSFSLVQNVREFQARGFLEPEPRFGGVPRAAIVEIDRLFREVEQGGDPERLKRELDRWGLFEYYEDRFLDLFRRRRR